MYIRALALRFVPPWLTSRHTHRQRFDHLNNDNNAQPTDIKKNCLKQKITLAKLLAQTFTRQQTRCNVIFSADNAMHNLRKVPGMCYNRL